jgi:hypothetical protein
LRSAGLALAQTRVVPAEEPHDDAVEELRPAMSEAIHRLERLLGREFPEWNSVHSPAPQESLA